MPSEIQQIKDLRQTIENKNEHIRLLNEVNAQLEAQLRQSVELRAFLNGKVAGIMELVGTFLED